MDQDVGSRPDPLHAVTFFHSFLAIWLVATIVAVVVASQYVLNLIS